MTLHGQICTSAVRKLSNPRGSLRFSAIPFIPHIEDPN